MYNDFSYSEDIQMEIDLNSLLLYFLLLLLLPVYSMHHIIILVLLLMKSKCHTELSGLNSE